MRCPICDFSSDTGQQSSYFNSLPRGERQKKRYEMRDPLTGERKLVCSECYPKPPEEKIE